MRKANEKITVMLKRFETVPPVVGVLQGQVFDLIESEEKKPIQIGKRVVRDEDSVCTGRQGTSVQNGHLGEVL